MQKCTKYRCSSYYATDCIRPAARSAQAALPFIKPTQWYVRRMGTNNAGTKYTKPSSTGYKKSLYAYVAPPRPAVRMQCTGDVCRKYSFGSYKGHKNGACGAAAIHARATTTTAAVPSSTAVIDFDPMGTVKTGSNLGSRGHRHGRGHGGRVAGLHAATVPAAVSVHAAANAKTGTTPGSIAYAAAAAAAGIAWDELLK